MTAEAIKFDHVSYQTANGKTLLSDLTLQVEEGETLVLLGRSGSGKTTTIKLINRLLDPTAGEIRIQGRSTVEWNAIRLRRRIGYVIQEVGLFPHFTVEENIAVVPRLEGWPLARIKNRVRELLRLVGLESEEFVERMPHELSGGQRQRVGVARALAADPPLILLDEPFGALDPITRRDLQGEFRALQQRLKKTMVLVTHDVREAFMLATRIGLLNAGRMVLLGPPCALLSSEDPEARAFADCFRDVQADEGRA